MPHATFALVVPVYNVERYLDDFIESLLAQTYGFGKLEVIFVDDGSTDGSLARLGEFQGQYPDNVTVLSKPNGGQASARNYGLDHVTADWVTFPDSDDVLGEDYFADVAAYIDETRDADVRLYAAHPILWWDATDKRKDSHVLAFRFRDGNTVSNLTTRPEWVQPHVTSGFFDISIITQHQLRFDERLRTRFEDGKFLCDYWLVAGQPVLGLVSTAYYYYRQRSDGSSSIQTNTVKPATYTIVPTLGYLAALEDYTAAFGVVPLWLQYFILYDLMWLLRSDYRTKRPTRALSPEVRTAFLDHIKTIMTYIDDATVYAFDLLAIPAWFRDALVHGFDPETPVITTPYFTAPDETMALMPIHYRFIGPQPDETVFVGGVHVDPRYVKTLPLTLFGHTFLMKRTLWVPQSHDVRVLLNGHLQRLEDAQLEPGTVQRRGRVFEQTLDTWQPEIPLGFRLHKTSTVRERMGAMAHGVWRTLRRWRRSRRWIDMWWRLAVLAPWVRRKYRDAWVLLDKDTEANDSAEALFRWIVAKHPEINAYFVVAKSSPDYRRLHDEGLRVVAHRSWRWKPLMLFARHVISSHADGYISNPLRASRYGAPQFRLDFLQHGIIKGDLSAWLNWKNLDLLVTSTDAEYDYITGVSPYKFSGKEARLTGLPRHDALLQKDAAIPIEEKRLILVAPTWREYLVGKRDGKTAARIRNTHFMDSEFAQAWMGVLHSQTLREFARAQGLKIAFLPHPNIQPYLDVMDVPDDIDVIHYTDGDVQQVICRTSTLVTDYSSMAFNAAYLRRPVVYFQFDREQYERGHTEGKGYFEYARDGFGPVATTPAEVTDAVQQLYTDAGYREQYLARCRATFPVRDGRNCERVFHAICDLDRQVSFETARHRAPHESWGQLVAEGKADPSAD